MKLLDFLSLANSNINVFGFLLGMFLLRIVDCGQFFPIFGSGDLPGDLLWCSRFLSLCGFLMVLVLSFFGWLLVVFSLLGFCFIFLFCWLFSILLVSLLSILYYTLGL